MQTSTILLSTPVVYQLMADNVDTSAFKKCSLTWKEDALIITSISHETVGRLPALESKSWLQSCLKCSPIRKIYLDPAMEATTIKAWIDICGATQKQAYLKLPSNFTLPQDHDPTVWRIKRLADWLMAALLLVIFSLPILLLALGIRLDSSGPILFRQWRVGHKGKLFQMYKFRSMEVDAERRHHEVTQDKIGLHKPEHDPRITRVGRWLRQLSLDEIPQLLNILQGEMSLVGPRPWALYDAVKIEPELQDRLNALPGITGPWQVSVRPNELDLYAVTCRDLAYMKGWNLLKDFRILLLTIPKVLFGIGDR